MVAVEVCACIGLPSRDVVTPGRSVGGGLGGHTRRQAQRTSSICTLRSTRHLVAPMHGTRSRVDCFRRSCRTLACTCSIVRTTVRSNTRPIRVEVCACIRQPRSDVAALGCCVGGGLGGHSRSPTQSTSIYSTVCSSVDLCASRSGTCARVHSPRQLRLACWTHACTARPIRTTCCSGTTMVGVEV